MVQNKENIMQSVKKGYVIKGWDGKSSLKSSNLSEEDFAKIFYDNVPDMEKNNELQLEDNYLYTAGESMANHPYLLDDFIKNSIKRINEEFKDLEVNNGLIAKEPFVFDYFDDGEMLYSKKFFPTKIPGLFVSETLTAEIMTGEYSYGVDTVDGKALEECLIRDKTVSLVENMPMVICAKDVRVTGDDEGVSITRDFKMGNVPIRMQGNIAVWGDIGEITVELNNKNVSHEMRADFEHMIRSVFSSSFHNNAVYKSLCDETVEEGKRMIDKINIGISNMDENPTVPEMDLKDKKMFLEKTDALKKLMESYKAIEKNADLSYQNTINVKIAKREK